jgi:hypothetical protein
LEAAFKIGFRVVADDDDCEIHHIPLPVTATRASSVACAARGHE